MLVPLWEWQPKEMRMRRREDEGGVIYMCSSDCMMLELCWAGGRGDRGEQTASPWVARHLGTTAGRWL